MVKPSSHPVTFAQCLAINESTKNCGMSSGHDHILPTDLYTVVDWTVQVRCYNYEELCLLIPDIHLSLDHYLPKKDDHDKI